MSLDDFTTGKSYEIGTVTTRKKPENISILEDDWKHLLMHDPHWADIFASSLNYEEIKCIIQMIDELIEGGSTRYASPSEKDIKEMKDERENLVERLKGDA